MLPTGLPEYKRRALRLSLGVFIPALFGFAILPFPSDSPDHEQLLKDLGTASKWSAITAAIVAQPLIGKASQVGTERTIGTILGGFCGFLIHSVGLLLMSEREDGLWLATAAGVLSACSVIVGYNLKLDTSARLFTITLLLVTFAGDSGASAFRTAVVRVTGILSGVILMLILSVIVLPKSATMETFHCMDKALASLSKLNSLAWGRFLTTAQQSNGMGLSPEAAVDLNQLHQPLAAGLNSNVQDQCEGMLTDIYSNLGSMQESMNSAKSEILLTRAGNAPLEHIVIVPGVPFRKAGAQHLPAEALHGAANALRRTARTLFTLSQALDDDLVQELRSLVSDYDVRLDHLATSSQNAIDALCRAFPLGSLADIRTATSQVVELMQHVDSWQDVVAKKQDKLASWHRYQAAKTNWQRVFNAVVKDKAPVVVIDTGLEARQEHPLQKDEGQEQNGEGSIPWSPLDAAVQVEWHSMTFLLYQLGQDFARLQEQLWRVMDCLP